MSPGQNEWPTCCRNGPGFKLRAVVEVHLTSAQFSCMNTSIRLCEDLNLCTVSSSQGDGLEKGRAVEDTGRNVRAIKLSKDRKA